VCTRISKRLQNQAGAKELYISSGHLAWSCPETARAKDRTELSILSKHSVGHLRFVRMVIIDRSGSKVGLIMDRVKRADLVGCICR
jgi:hypothetical protein